MPGFDQTGPMGQGPRTGRGLGRCGGATEVVQQPGRGGMGLGLGRRNRRGFRNRVVAEPVVAPQQPEVAADTPPAPEPEADPLRDELEATRAAVSQLQARLESLEGRLDVEGDA